MFIYHSSRLTLKLKGGRSETRTHTPLSEPSVFKTAAARPTRLTLPNCWLRVLGRLAS